MNPEETPPIVFAPLSKANIKCTFVWQKNVSGNFEFFVRLEPWMLLQLLLVLQAFVSPCDPRSEQLVLVRKKHHWQLIIQTGPLFSSMHTSRNPTRGFRWSWMDLQNVSLHCVLAGVAEASFTSLCDDRRVNNIFPWCSCGIILKFFCFPKSQPQRWLPWHTLSDFVPFRPSHRFYVNYIYFHSFPGDFPQPEP